MFVGLPELVRGLLRLGGDLGHQLQYMVHAVGGLYDVGLEVGRVQVHYLRGRSAVRERDGDGELRAVERVEGGVHAGQPVELPAIVLHGVERLVRPQSEPVLACARFGLVHGGGVDRGPEPLVKVGLARSAGVIAVFPHVFVVGFDGTVIQHAGHVVVLSQQLSLPDLIRFPTADFLYELRVALARPYLARHPVQLAARHVRLDAGDVVALHAEHAAGVEALVGIIVAFGRYHALRLRLAVEDDGAVRTGGEQGVVHRAVGLNGERGGGYPRRQGIASLRPRERDAHDRRECGQAGGQGEPADRGPFGARTSAGLAGGSAVRRCARARARPRLVASCAAACGHLPGCACGPSFGRRLLQHFVTQAVGGSHLLYLRSIVVEGVVAHGRPPFRKTGNRWLRGA